MNKKMPRGSTQAAVDRFDGKRTLNDGKGGWEVEESAVFDPKNKNLRTLLGGEGYTIENPESEIRSPGQSPEQHQIINESQAEPEIPNEAANYTGTYNGADVKAFNDKLAAITGKRESKGEPANLVAGGEKNYADPYAQNISSLLKRYQEASEAKSAQENKGGAWSMVVGNALGPEAGRATLQSWQSGADEGVENLDRQQKAATGQIKNDDSLFALARKSRAADPNSPLSKALTEYERKNTGFGKDAAGAEIPGLSAQDALEAGKGVVTPIYKEQQSTKRNDDDNFTTTTEKAKDRTLKADEGNKDRANRTTNTTILADSKIGAAALGQDASSAAGAAGMATMGMDGGAGGAVASAAMQIGIQEGMRAISYAGQLAGIGVGGLMETFSLNDSALADPGKSWLGRIAMGVAGARPALPNSAGASGGNENKDMAESGKTGANEPPGPMDPTQLQNGGQGGAGSEGQSGANAQNIDNSTTINYTSNNNTAHADVATLADYVSASQSGSG